VREVTGVLLSEPRRKAAMLAVRQQRPTRAERQHGIVCDRKVKESKPSDAAHQRRVRPE
jgi:hypothetical protein